MNTMTLYLQGLLTESLGGAQTHVHIQNRQWSNYYVCDVFVRGVAIKEITVTPAEERSHFYSI